ncbi:MAG: MFS transporter [Candidatus Eremiobacteraeota bacterium]|nr:MFS transporter [Candidatus Eremiobacteraeota bacterium]
MDGERKKYLLIIASASFAAFMGKLDAYIVNISLPTIAKAFHISTSEVSLVVISYLLFLTCTLLIFGKLSDRLGLKRIFIGGYVTFVAGSLLCGISGSLPALVASRALQGTGGAMLATSAYAIIPTLLPRGITGWGFGLLATANALGVCIGAPLGGFITGCYSWHGIFLVNIPLGILAILLALKVIPADRPQKSGGRGFDFAGAALSFIAVVACMISLNRGHGAGWSSPLIIGGFLLAAVTGTAFIAIERRQRSPLLDLAIFRDRGFVLAVAASSIGYLYVSGISFLMPFYLQLVLGLTPQGAGMVIMVFSVVFVLVGPSAGKLSDRVSPSLLCALSMASSTVATLFFLLVLPAKSLTLVIIFMIWIAVSFALFFTPNNKLVMSGGTEGLKGSVAAFFNMSINLSITLGVCIFEVAYSSVLPAKGPGGDMPSGSSLLAGFSRAYLIGVIFCAVSGLLSLLCASGKAGSTVGEEGAGLPPEG